MQVDDKRNLSGPDDGRSEDSVKSSKHSVDAQKGFEKDSIRTAHVMIDELVVKYSDARRQEMTASSSSNSSSSSSTGDGDGEVSDMVKLRVKLEAVGVECAHSESQSLKRLTAKVRGSDDVAAVKQQPGGRREEEVLCVRDRADVAGRLEDEIERLRGACSVLRTSVRDSPPSYPPSHPFSVPYSDRLSHPPSNLFSNPLLIPLSIPLSNTPSYPSTTPPSYPSSGLQSRSDTFFFRPPSPSHTQALSPSHATRSTQGAVKDDISKYESVSEGVSEGVNVHILTGEPYSPRPAPPSARIKAMKGVRVERDEYKDLFEIEG